MALDEALLEAWSPGDPPVLRLYAWSPAALSLGRFQSAQGVVVPEGAELVRRLTGGAAIHHRMDEVTYSVVAPYSLFGDRDPRSAYRAVHAVIGAALEALGVTLEARTGGAARATTEGRCFSTPTDYDLVAGQRKLVGSAQRRRGQAFLQHGSLPLTTDPEAAGATSISELLGRPVDPRNVEEAILSAAALHLAGQLVHDAPRANELELARRIDASRYSAQSWTLDR